MKFKILIIASLLVLKAASVQAQSDINLIKTISYCTGTYSALSMFAKGDDKKNFEEKKEFTLKLIPKVILKSSLNKIEANALAKDWYEEKMEFYRNTIKNKYSKPDGKIDNEFFKLLFKDDESCNFQLNIFAKVFP